MIPVGVGLIAFLHKELAGDSTHCGVWDPGVGCSASLILFFQMHCYIVLPVLLGGCHLGPGSSAIRRGSNSPAPFVHFSDLTGRLLMRLPGNRTPTRQGSTSFVNFPDLQHFRAAFWAPRADNRMNPSAAQAEANRILAPCRPMRVAPGNRAQKFFDCAVAPYLIIECSYTILLDPLEAFKTSPPTLFLNTAAPDSAASALIFRQVHSGVPATSSSSLTEKLRAFEAQANWRPRRR